MDLASLDALYTQAEVAKAGNTDALPDGKYQVAVHGFELKETRDSKKPMIAWQFKVLAGPHEGRSIFKNDVLEADRLPYVKKDLTTVGWTGNLSDLQDPLARQRVLDVKLEITQKTNTRGDKSYVNVYVNRRLDVVVAQTSHDGSLPPF